MFITGVCLLAAVSVVTLASARQGHYFELVNAAVWTHLTPGRRQRPSFVAVSCVPVTDTAE